MTNISAYVKCMYLSRVFLYSIKYGIVYILKSPTHITFHTINIYFQNNKYQTNFSIERNYSFKNLMIYPIIFIGHQTLKIFKFSKMITYLRIYIYIYICVCMYMK